MIAIFAFLVELVALLVGAVWVVGRIKADSMLNRQASKNLKETLGELSTAIKELADATSDIDTRLTILETRQTAK